MSPEERRRPEDRANRDDNNSTTTSEVGHPESLSAPSGTARVFSSCCPRPRRLPPSLEPLDSARLVVPHQRGGKKRGVVFESLVPTDETHRHGI